MERVHGIEPAVIDATKGHPAWIISELVRHSKESGLRPVKIENIAPLAKKDTILAILDGARNLDIPKPDLIMDEGSSLTFMPSILG